MLPKSNEATMVFLRWQLLLALMLSFGMNVGAEPSSAASTDIFTVAARSVLTRTTEDYLGVSLSVKNVSPQTQRFWASCEATDTWTFSVAELEAMPLCLRTVPHMRSLDPGQVWESDVLVAYKKMPEQIIFRTGFIPWASEEALRHSWGKKLDSLPGVQVYWSNELHIEKPAK